MRVLRCAPQVAATIASALLCWSESLFAEANGRSGHYSVDDIIRKQDEVTAFEETLRKADALIKKSRRGGGDSLPLQENRTKKDGLETPSVEGEGRELAARKLNLKKKNKNSKNDKKSSSLQNELNQCLARVELLEKEVDKKEKDPNPDKDEENKKEIRHLYLQESEKCEITREKSRNGKTAWKIESSNLNRITFRYSSIPYRLAWKEPSYLFALKFPSIFGDDGPNAVLTSGDETVVFFINKVEYEFDEETKTSKQVYEIEQSEEQEEVSPLSGLLGETSDGKTFEHCKYFIDDAGTSALISDDTRFAKIRNTLNIALASKEIHEAAPESSPSGITGSSVDSFLATQGRAVATLVHACANGDSIGCNVHTVSTTTGGFLLGAAGVLAAALPPLAVVLAVFGVVAELIGIFSTSSTSTNPLIKEIQRQGLLQEISAVVTADLNANDIQTSSIKLRSYAIDVASVTKGNYGMLHEIQSATDTTTIDAYVEGFYSETFVLNWPLVQKFSIAINEFVQTAGFERTSTFDPINTWLKSVIDKTCSFPIWPNIKTCNNNVESAKSTYNQATRDLSTYLAEMQVFVQWTSLSIKILTSHSSCTAGIKKCEHYTALKNLWFTQQDSVTLRSHGIKGAIETLKTCGPTSACTVCDGTHPFDQTCPSASQCTFPYLTISVHTEMKNYVPNLAAAKKVQVGVYESDAKIECQSFVDKSRNPFHGGISATFTSSPFYSCADKVDYFDPPPGVAPQQISAVPFVWCVMPPAPNQQDCGTLVNYVDDVLCEYCDFAVYALKGYSLDPTGGDTAAILACQNAITNKDVFGTWPNPASFL